MGENLLVIFDFDGTIADTAKSLKILVNKLSDDFDFRKIKEADWQELRNKESKEIFRSLGISLTKLPYILRKIRRDLQKELEKIKPVEGIKEALLEIKNNKCKLGILTSNSSAAVAKFLKINQLDFFDFIRSESDIFNKAKKLNNLLKKEKFDRQNVFYVGDETRDIKAARKAKVKAVAVSWGFNGREILKKQNPDYLVNKPEELIALLNNF